MYIRLVIKPDGLPIVAFTLKIQWIVVLNNNSSNERKRLLSLFILSWLFQIHVSNYTLSSFKDCKVLGGKRTCSRLGLPISSRSHFSLSVRFTSASKELWALVPLWHRRQSRAQIISAQTTNDILNTSKIISWVRSGSGRTKPVRVLWYSMLWRVWVIFLLSVMSIMNFKKTLEVEICGK